MGQLTFLLWQSCFCWYTNHRSLTDSYPLNSNAHEEDEGATVTRNWYKRAVLRITTSIVFIHGQISKFLASQFLLFKVIRHGVKIWSFIAAITVLEQKSSIYTLEACSRSVLWWRLRFKCPRTSTQRAYHFILANISWWSCQNTKDTRFPNDKKYNWLWSILEHTTTSISRQIWIQRYQRKARSSQTQEIDAEGRPQSRNDTFLEARSITSIERWRSCWYCSNTDSERAGDLHGWRVKESHEEVPSNATSDTRLKIHRVRLHLTGYPSGHGCGKRNTQRYGNHDKIEHHTDASERVLGGWIEVRSGTSSCRTRNGF